MNFSAVAVLGLSTLLLAACVSGAPDSGEAASSEDELVATFDQLGTIDLAKTTRVLLVGDSSELGDLPLHAAATKARRFAQLHPEEQIVLFLTKDVRDASVARVGATIVKEEPFGGALKLADFRRLSGTKLVDALDRFERIASIEFFGHSTPFNALLEPDGDDHNLGPEIPANVGKLTDNFARDTNPYVSLNGCNGGTAVAPQLSKIWALPVSGALTASNFEALMSDGHWYINDKGFYPAELRPATMNDRSFGAMEPASCTRGACIRMKPQDAPYWGYWSDPKSGFQYGLSYYKFFCDYDDPTGTCAKGMAESLYSFPGEKPLARDASDDDFKEALADFFCTRAKDPAWFDTCKAGLFAAAESGADFSPMRSGNDFSLECDFAKCDAKLRCKMVNGAPQPHTCAWVTASCTEAQSNAACKVKTATKQTTRRELLRYLEGHRLNRGS